MKRFLLRHAYFVGGIIISAVMLTVTDVEHGWTSWRYWLGFWTVFVWGEFAITIDQARTKENVFK